MLLKHQVFKSSPKLRYCAAPLKNLLDRTHRPPPCALAHAPGAPRVDSTTPSKGDDRLRGVHHRTICVLEAKDPEAGISIQRTSRDSVTHSNFSRQTLTSQPPACVRGCLSVHQAVERGEKLYPQDNQNVKLQPRTARPKPPLVILAGRGKKALSPYLARRPGSAWRSQPAACCTRASRGVPGSDQPQPGQNLG